MTNYPHNDVNKVGFPESQLIWRTTPEKCAEISAAFHQGTLEGLEIDDPQLKELCDRLGEISAKYQMGVE
ncbi:hypothetical protein VB713_12415 [Anabaena cylindrica UHCC 0172]|uniref:hypothetical protein n=1 Tax=Anabaena cylindrica TaxID=1165 RepID=UPI002B203A13|nr:hypothetical protein [Anabaena cylindrica]MEA5551776.1 hypothetical protein [Anabaena cylindrica UHCC 0172]